MIQFVVGVGLIVLFAWKLSWWLLVVIPVLTLYRAWYFRRRQRIG